MKLLILTQKIDKNDDVLGFFHGWVERFSKDYEKVTVICLGRGEVSLPSNVEVFSLGKEDGVSKLSYVLKFWSLIFKKKKEYDVVFVHMNQEYVLLGGLLWRLLGKKIFMWRNHPHGNILTRIAVALSNKVFCTSPFSYTAKFKKTTIMPVGVDTERFRPYEAIREKGTILSLGRISPIKKVDLIVRSALTAIRSGANLTLNIVGNATDKDQEYFSEVKKLAEGELAVGFSKGVPNSLAPNLLARAEVFINMTPDGSLDKTIFEAMASGALVLTSNSALKEIIDDELMPKKDDAEDLAEKIIKLISLSDFEKENLRNKYRKYVEDHHSLNTLSEKLRFYFSGSK